MKDTTKLERFDAWMHRVKSMHVASKEQMYRAYEIILKPR